MLCVRPVAGTWWAPWPGSVVDSVVGTDVRLAVPRDALVSTEI
jgi:hypothetical protein